MNKNYDIHSANSIIEYAKKLKGKTLREVCGFIIEKQNYKGKGNFGQLVEKFYFGYEPNSKAEPDFPEAGLELKTSPLKIIKKDWETINRKMKFTYLTKNKLKFLFLPLNCDAHFFH